MTLDESTAGYIKTIVDAAAAGTVCTDGMEVIGLVMRGYTLDGAKQRQRENEAMRAKNARVLKTIAR